MTHEIDEKKEFLQKLKGLSYSRSPHRTFSDWLEIAAISLHQLPYHSGELERDAAFEQLEQTYLERIKPYRKDELNSFAELSALTISALGNGKGYGDFLGEIAGEAELLNKGGGQFFTPYCLCQAIANMTLGDVYQAVKEKGIITACEPAVGSGSLVIASAEEVDMQGIDPRAHMQFDCTDISRDAFNMAYIQLSALGLQAVVRHGNSLSMECWEHRPTPQLRLFNQWLERQQRSQQLVQAVRSLCGRDALSLCGRDAPSLFKGEIAPVPEPSTTLFDVGEFAAVEQGKQTRSRCLPDIVLDQQMSLFGA